MTYFPPARGFTLVETLVAITVLTVAIVGPLHAVQRAVSLSYTARDQLIASSLAQEGIEFVRAVRDGNYHANLPWMNGFSALTCYSAGTPHYCSIDANPSLSFGTAVQQYDSDEDVPALFIDSTYHYNQQGSGTQTRFTRYVRITEISADEVRVVSTVTWRTLGSTYTFQLQETLTRWL